MNSNDVDLGVETGIHELRGVRFSTRAAELVALGWAVADHDQPIRFWNQTVELTRTAVWLGQTWSLRILTTTPLHVDVWPPNDSNETQLLEVLTLQFGRPAQTKPLPRWSLASGLSVSIEDDLVVFSLEHSRGSARP